MATTSLPYSIYSATRDESLVSRVEAYTVTTPVDRSAFDRKPLVGAFALRVRTLLGRGSV